MDYSRWMATKSTPPSMMPGMRDTPGMVGSEPTTSTIAPRCRAQTIPDIGGPTAQTGRISSSSQQRRSTALRPRSHAPTESDATSPGNPSALDPGTYPIPPAGKPHHGSTGSKWGGALMKRSVSLFKRKKKKPASASAADDPPTTPTGGSRYAHPEPANETRVSGNPPSLSHGVIHHHHHQPHSQPQGPPNRASVVDSSAGEAQANSSRFSFSSTESEGKPTLMQRVREAASRKWGPMRRKQRDQDRASRGSAGNERRARPHSTAPTTATSAWSRRATWSTSDGGADAPVPCMPNKLTRKPRALARSATVKSTKSDSGVDLLAERSRSLSVGRRRREPPSETWVGRRLRGTGGVAREAWWTA